jgi:hypothetical protein
MDFAWNFSTLMKSLKLYKWMFSTQDRDSRVELLLLVDAFHIIALLVLTTAFIRATRKRAGTKSGRYAYCISEFFSFSLLKVFLPKCAYASINK